MTREEIKNNLDSGDYIKIARLCAVDGIKTNTQYIGQVVRGDKPTYGSRGTGKKILDIAEKIATENNQLKKCRTSKKQHYETEKYPSRIC